MKKPKILWHLPYGIFGGVETLYATILKYMGDDFDHYVTCVVSIYDTVEKRYKNLARIKTFTNQFDLAAAIDAINPDLIMGTHGGSLYSALTVVRRNYPVVEIVHGSHLWGEHNAYMPKDWTKHVVCVSKSAERVYRKADRYKLDTSVIINGVDTDIFNPKKALARQTKNIAYFGRLMESDKHITKIVTAFKSLGDHHSRLHLIGGTNEEIVRLKHFVRSLKIEPLVKFFGHSDNPVEYYKQVDVATVRSEAEGYCNSAAEALATGTPLVCYNFGGILDHVEPGTIAIANSQAEYAEQLRRVYYDYNLRKEMRRLGLVFANGVGNAQHTAKAYTQLIHEVLSGLVTRIIPSIESTQDSSDELLKSILPNKKSARNKAKIAEGNISAKKVRNIELPGIGNISIANLRPTVGVFNPHWHGIATATRNCTEEHVHWNQDPQIMIKNILRHKPRAVLFSGMCPGFDYAIKGLKRQSPGTRIFGYYHGGISHYSFGSGLFGSGEREAFKKMLTLQKEGYLQKIAVSSPGLAEVLNANGYNAEFCGNLMPLKDHYNFSSPFSDGVHIGNWNRPHDHKHTTIGIGAHQLIPNSKLHCLKGVPEVPGLNYDNVIRHNEMSQEALRALYGKMHVNLQMSFIETFNISVLEMWAAGRPVIISPSNLVLVEGNDFLEGFIPKDPTNAVLVAKMIEKAIVQEKAMVDAQFEQLLKLNKDSVLRWEGFFQ